MANADLVRAALPCSVELPAGTGKTETIAELVKSFAAEGGRSLVLTHTHAGVDVIRRRMRKFGVPSAAVTIRTLDSWCFDLIASFPVLSGIDVEEEPDWGLTQQYHEAGQRAVVTEAVLRMLRASYELVVIDEYQDCQIWQHELVVQISHAVPTCVLGDRMQGLFFFGRARPVDWDQDVLPAFPAATIPVHYWRWHVSNPKLGEWLLDARSNLMNDIPLDLASSPVGVKSPSELHATLFGLPPHPVSTVAIVKWPKDAAVLALKLGGGYTMIEELEGKFLRAFAEIVDNGTSVQIADATLGYVLGCAFGVAGEIHMNDRRPLQFGTPINLDRVPSGLTAAVAALNALLVSSGVGAIRRTLVAFSRFPGFKLYRREAWFGMLDALRLCETTDDLTALAAVVSIRNKMRSMGRRPESRIVGRSLLVKGLEFDHAVVIGPEGLNAHELYVCLTRGSQSVTVISDRTTFQPPRPQRS
jgi:hypothetical protein